MLKYISNSESQTEQIGEHLGACFRAGSLVAMFGGMGAGKTALVRGIARGMEFDGRVTSPTYAIVNEYVGRIPLFHFDLYRLSCGEDLYDIGFEEYLTRGGVSVVEWFERSDNMFPWDVKISIEKDPQNENAREIIIETQGCMKDEDFSN